MASISTNLWHPTISRMVKELVSIRCLLTFFVLLRFLPTECPQNSLKPGEASKTRKGWFSCRCLWSHVAFPSINRVPLHDANQRHNAMQFTALRGFLIP